MPPKPPEIIEICHEAIVQQLLYKDVAKKHRVSVNVVSIYVNKARKNKEFMSELFAKSRGQQIQKDIVCTTV